MVKGSESTAASAGMHLGWGATSTMFGGLILFGGIGWLLDHWWQTRFATPIGVLLGLGLGVYAVVMRYGREPIESDSDESGESSSTGQGR